MGRCGHKIECEWTCGETVSDEMPQKQAGRRGRWGWTVPTCILPYRRCPGKQYLTSVQVPIRRENWALISFHMRGIISHHERNGDDFSAFTHYTFPLFTPFKHFYFKKQASHSYESAKIYSFSQTNMTASCQGNKGGLEEDSGHWEGMHLLWKAVGQCWGKACQNAMEKLKWPDHYKRSVRVLPSSFGRSCSWVQSCDGWARGI